MIELNVTDIASGNFFVISIVLMDKLLSHQLGNSEFRTRKIDGLFSISTTYLPKTMSINSLF